MGRLHKNFSWAEVENVESAEGAEKIILTLEGVGTEWQDQEVFLEVSGFYTTPATAEEATWKVRRGATLTSTLVKEWKQKDGAEAVKPFGINLLDKPGLVAGQSYVLTLTEKKATVKDTVKLATMQAIY